MSDYLYTLESHLDASQAKAVGAVQRIATESGMNAWLAGGAMRDMLRGAPIRDLDFVVERDALKIAKAVAQTLGGKVLSEDEWKRGAELELPGHVMASVSNSRTEKYTKSGGKPQMSPATIHEDLARRDFTINAIALALNRGSRGLLIDPTNGQADLVNRELRTTSGSTFFDDPTRIFRLIRFRHMLGFEVAPRAQSQFENALLENYQKNASPVALAHEIRAAFSDVSVVGMLEAFDANNLLKILSPSLTGAKLNVLGLTKLEKIMHSTVPPGTPGGSFAFLNVLTEKLNSQDRAAVVRSFALTHGESTEFKQLAAQAKKLESALKSSRIHKPSDVWGVLHTSSSDEILMVLYQSNVRVVHDRIRSYYEKYLPTAQEVTEDQVIASGAKPGTPKFDKTFHAMIVTRLNARPRKVVEPEPTTPATAAMASRGRK